MAEPVPVLRLRRGRAKPLHAGHPWVFADALEPCGKAAPPAGAEVRVVDPQGQVLGHGYYSPASAIAVRLLTRGDEAAGADLLARRIAEALALRATVLPPDPARPTDALRLVNSEGDGLGGLVVDRYADCLCVQFGTAGMYQRREALLDALAARLDVRAILDKADAQARRIEGLAPASGGAWRGAPPDGPVRVLEYGLACAVDLRPGKGQKTGLYLDQRENRRRFGEFARGCDVLDVCAYTGGFTLHAARGGAKSLTLVEASEAALQGARANLELNGVEDAELVCAEWTAGFRHLREAGRTFDLAVLDPPKFAAAKDAVEAALSGYRELNAQAARLLRPGALLFTCSCSGNVGEREFERAVASGLARAGRRAALLERRGAGPDHPVPPGFEQGSYLKCLVLRLE